MELSDVAAFVKVVQAGSFTQAARLLAMPKSTVSAKVAGLERRLGVSLLKRTTRKLHVTPEGDDFFRSCAKALGEIEAAEAAVASGRASPKGIVSLTAPAGLGRFLAVFLRGFLARYPDIEVDLILTNRYVDLVGEGVDVALRAGELKDSTLVARRINTHQRGLVAAPDYLEAAGVPKHPDELPEHACIRFGAGRSTEWRLEQGQSVVTIPVTGRVGVDDMDVLKQLAIEGHGLALMPHFMVQDEVRDGRLVQVLPGWHTAASPFGIVYPAQKFQHPKVRVLVDELAEALKEHLAACG